MKQEIPCEFGPPSVQVELLVDQQPDASIFYELEGLLGRRWASFGIRLVVRDSICVDASLQIHGEQPEMMSSCASDVFVGTFLGDLGNQSHCFRGSSLRIENNS